ncbi:MAG: hypothetical protein ACJAY5_001415, partial [Actinomycetes bacterium]
GNAGIHPTDDDYRWARYSGWGKQSRADDVLVFVRSDAIGGVSR